MNSHSFRPQWNEIFLAFYSTAPIYYDATTYRRFNKLAQIFNYSFSVYKDTGHPTVNTDTLFVQYVADYWLRVNMNMYQLAVNSCTWAPRLFLIREHFTATSFQWRKLLPCIIHYAKAPINCTLCTVTVLLINASNCYNDKLKINKNIK